MSSRDAVDLGDATPAVRIVAGHPDDDEVAAVVAALVIMRSRTPGGDRAGLDERPSDWAGYWRHASTAGARRRS